MKEYCFDTSGISTPRQNNPEDIYVSLWGIIKDILASGRIAVNTEIYDEMVLIDGGIGEHIKANKSELLLEIGDESWNWRDYLQNVQNLQEKYQDFISEYCNNRKDTVSTNDISIIALAKSLGVPLLAMESSANNSPTKMRIVDICEAENIDHLYFNDFLIAENILL